jgi:hypothetical protein
VRQKPRNKSPNGAARLRAWFDDYKEEQMEMLGAVSQFLAVLNGNHFAAVVLIALVAVANRHPPKD